jgi:hypothetical protein
MDTASCNTQKIQMNSAKSALEQASSAYWSCLPPSEAGNVALDNAGPMLSSFTQQAEALETLQSFILKQLQREVDDAPTVSSLREAAQEEHERLQKEIDAVKAEIRVEKRKFLDANPSATTAVAGLYYTQQPDNQLLIAFITTFCLFLLSVGILIILNKVPGLTELLSRTQLWERVRLVGMAWVLSLLVVYIYFFSFT